MYDQISTYKVSLYMGFSHQGKLLVRPALQAMIEIYS